MSYDAYVYTNKNKYIYVHAHTIICTNEIIPLYLHIYIQCIQNYL
jgi:hypothetical protein